MKQLFKLVPYLTVALCATLAFTRLASAQSSTSPSAYVYVATLNGTQCCGTSGLYGYSADSSGALTPLPGSPFWIAPSGYFPQLAHTAHWLFLSDGTYVYSFSIASNGMLTQVSSVNAMQNSPCQCDAVMGLFLDHSGSTLYVVTNDAGNETIQFYAKDNTTGGLTYFGATSQESVAGVLSFIGNNEYAYRAGCSQFSPAFYSARRNDDGSLTRFFIEPPIPAYPGGSYCTFGQAADPAGNLAVGLNHGNQIQLGVYTADSSGNLTTNSTYQNMPYVDIQQIEQLSMSPAGNLLAVGGDFGLQVFHFNGSNPITHYTPLLATHQLWRLAWDTHSHLYGVSTSNRVYSFKITTTGYKQAPGSPYIFPDVPAAITVLSK